MKKILFIDRDGTLIIDPPPSYQVDSFEKLEFCPGVFTWLGKIAGELDFELVLVTNQDGLGTASFPEYNFWPVQNFVINALRNENIIFSEVCIDKSLPEEKAPTRKPGTAMLKKYLENPDYDITGSFVIGDRMTDVLLAKNLGCNAILINNEKITGAESTEDIISSQKTKSAVVLETASWKEIYTFLKLQQRVVIHERKTNETEIKIVLNLDGQGQFKIDTGLHFFNHMLEQLAKHSGADLEITVKGDLHIDEHHTIEDTAIALGEAFARALGNKAGIQRYAFVLPMDDALAQVAVDIGGRAWLTWDALFKREKIGDMPTEMFCHFFKSLSDAARWNLHIRVSGDNEHHKIEAIFKAFAKAIKEAVKRDINNMQLPTTKGIL